MRGVSEGMMKHVKGPRAVTSLNGDVKVLLGVGDRHEDPVIVGSPLQPEVDAVADSTVALMHAFRDARDQCGSPPSGSEREHFLRGRSTEPPGVVAVDVVETWINSVGFPRRGGLGEHHLTREGIAASTSGERPVPVSKRAPSMA